MPAVTDPGNFVDDTIADADAVNARFAPLYAALAGNLDEANMAVPKGLLCATMTASWAVASGIALPLDAETFDVSGWHRAATGPGNGVYVPQVAGYYRLSWLITSAAPPALGKFWQSTLIKTAVEAHRGTVCIANGTHGVASGGTAIVTANGSTDYFGLAVIHDIGGSVAVQLGAAHTYMHAELIGRS